MNDVVIPNGEAKQMGIEFDAAANRVVLRSLVGGKTKFLSSIIGKVRLLGMNEGIFLESGDSFSGWWECGDLQEGKLFHISLKERSIG